jgi:hypothetical protein
MRPTGYELHPKKGLMLHFECSRCGYKGRNLSLQDDPLAADDYQRILSLTRPV